MVLYYKQGECDLHHLYNVKNNTEEDITIPERLHLAAWGSYIGLL